MSPWLLISLASYFVGNPINIEPVNAWDLSTGERELMHRLTDCRELKDADNRRVSYNKLAHDKADDVEAAQSSPVLTPTLSQQTLFSPVAMQHETSNQAT